MEEMHFGVNRPRSDRCINELVNGKVLRCDSMSIHLRESYRASGPLLKILNSILPRLALSSRSNGAPAITIEWIHTPE